MRRHVPGSGKTRMPRGAGPGEAAIPLLGQQDPPGPVGLKDRDLLLEDRRDERLHEPAGTAEPQVRVPQRGVTDLHRVRGLAAKLARRRLAVHWPRAPGSASSSHSAPGPPRSAHPVQDRRRRVPAKSPAWAGGRPGGGERSATWTGARHGSTRIVAGPSGVSDVRQIAPASSARNVGSPLPRPCTESAEALDIDGGTARGPLPLRHRVSHGYPCPDAGRQARPEAGCAPGRNAPERPPAARRPLALDPSPSSSPSSPSSP